MSYVDVKFNKNVFFKSLLESNIHTDQQLLDLRAIEDTIMVGYPVGIYDQYHNLPLFRKGITSSHPGIDYQNTSVGVLDIASFRGSSGSPVCIVNEGAYSLKSGTTKVGSNRFIFLGVLTWVGKLDTNNQIKMIEVPASTVPIVTTETMTNFGYYIKSREILQFKSKIMDAYIKQKA